jgi:hypothetical protein
LLELEREGYTINRGDVVILSKFTITSNIYKHFRNPVFDIYYKSKKREGLVFVESKKIDGTYSFNEENKVYISFESFDQSIIDEALISGGASFFLKLKDFTVYDTSEQYISILSNVLAKSIPVTIAYEKNDEGNDFNIETFFVGTNATPTKLSQILKTALKDTVLMTDSSIDQIKGFANKIRTYGESGTNETLKWFVGANTINDNIFSYPFNVNEGISLAYVSDKKLENNPIFLSRLVLDNNIATSSTGLLPPEVRNLKIKFTPKKLEIPFEDWETFIRADCPRSDRGYEVNQIHYKRIIPGYVSKISLFKDLSLPNISLSIKSAKGSILEGTLTALINSKIVSLSKSESNGFIISLSKSVVSSLNKEQGQLTINFNLSVPTVSLNIGHTVITQRQCVEQPRQGCDCAAHGHMKAGLLSGQKFQQSEFFDGNGFSSEIFKHQYDMNIQVLNY